MFHGLVWGGLAAWLLYWCGYEVLEAIETKLPAGLVPNSTQLPTAEQKELLNLDRLRSACGAAAQLATATEVVVNAWFSLSFFEQQVGRFHFHSLVACF